jgi:hypothetical protein
MSDSIPLKRSRMSWLAKFPWTFLLIGYLLVAHFYTVDMNGVPGYVFVGLGVFVLFAEFFKSGDIGVAVFFADILSAVVAVVIATGLMSYLIFALKQDTNFFHWFGYAIILGDAVFSPFNSFRTALRNFGVGS